MEVQTELPVFGGTQQDAFDRAALTTEVFHGKLAALLPGHLGRRALPPLPLPLGVRPRA